VTYQWRADDKAEPAERGDGGDRRAVVQSGNVASGAVHCRDNAADSDAEGEEADERGALVVQQQRGAETQGGDDGRFESRMWGLNRRSSVLPAKRTVNIAAANSA
jgi:hypothetical protein